MVLGRNDFIARKKKQHTRKSTWHLRNFGKSSKKSSKRLGGIRARTSKIHIVQKLRLANIDCLCTICQQTWPSCHTKGQVAAPRTTAMTPVAGVAMVSAPLGHQPLQPFLRQCWCTWTEAAQHLRREAPVTPKISALMLQDTHVQVLSHYPLTHCAVITSCSIVAKPSCRRRKVVQKQFTNAATRLFVFFDGFCE